MASAEAERTAAFVRQRQRLGVVSRRRATPRPRFPHLIESDYARLLIGILDQQRVQLRPLLEELPRLVASARQNRADEAKVRRTERCGMAIAIENRAGSQRRWTDSDGTRGSTTMKFDYGYIEGFLGSDGEDVDVYLGPLADPSEVYVVHQQRKSSGFAEYDEDKVMLGWSSEATARAAYLAQYNDPRFLGSVTVLELDDFKRRLRASPGRAITASVAWREDAGEGRRSSALLDRVRDSSRTAARSTQESAMRIAQRVSAHQRVNLDRQVQARLGTAVPIADVHVPATIDHFVAENVALIRSLARKQLDEIETMVARAFTAGDRHETLADALQLRFNIHDRHARLIARDQVAKLNAQITRARHAELGIARFRWLTANDNRVRSHHASKNKLVWAYKTGAGAPVPPFFPGQEVCCRCGEEPMFDDILALLGGSAAADPPAPPAPPPSVPPSFPGGSSPPSSSSSSTSGTTTVANPVSPAPSLSSGGSTTGADRLPANPIAPIAPLAPTPPIPDAHELAGRVIRRISPLGGGVNESFRVILDDGSEAVWKPVTGERKDMRTNVGNGTQHVREAATSRVAGLLGVGDLVPTTVVHTHQGVVGSLQRYASKAIPYPKASGPRFDRTDAERMRVFDFVVGNSDRHQKNFLVGGPPHRPVPVLIDHGLNFPSGPPARFLQPWKAIPHDRGPLHPATIAQVQKIDLQQLAATLLDSGLDVKAVAHTLYRAELLKLQPELLEVARAGSDRAWDGIAKTAHTRLPVVRRNAIDAMIASLRGTP